MILAWYHEFYVNITVGLAQNRHTRTLFVTWRRDHSIGELFLEQKGHRYATAREDARVIAHFEQKLEQKRRRDVEWQVAD